MRHPVIKRLAHAALPESELAALPLKKMLSCSSDSRKKSEKRRMNISERCGLFIEPPERPFTDVS